MKNSTKVTHIIWLAVGLMMFAGIAGGVMGQGGGAAGQDDDIFAHLKQPVKDIHIQQVTITQAISRISIDYGVPIGLETEYPAKDVKEDINVERGTLEDVFNAISGSFRAYEWTTIDGVINFSPKTKIESILDVTVSQYKTKDTLALDLRSSITELPEVITRMREMRVEPLHVSVGSLNGRIMDEHFSLEVKNKTVRSILNELAKNSFDKYWGVSRGGDKGEYLFVYL